MPICNSQEAADRTAAELRASGCADVRVRRYASFIDNDGKMVYRFDVTVHSAPVGAVVKKSGKRGYVRIAEHLGTDADSVRECEYQHGRFGKPVFALADNEYWCGGKPHDRDGLLTNWVEVVSSYDGSILYKCVSE